MSKTQCWIFTEEFIMGLRIKTNVETLTAQRFLSNNNSDLTSSMEKLSSGSRINKSADDAAGLAISEGLRAKTRSLLQAKRNANDGISLVQVAEGGLNETTNILIRMRELTMQSASDTVSEIERSYIDKEYQELTQEIDRISETTEFNGRKLLSAETYEEPITLQVGYNGTENDILTLQFAEDATGISSEILGLSDTTLAGTDREEIADNLNKIDESLNMIASTRATLGAAQSRLNSAISNISINTENMMAANSRIRDTDFAEETAKFSQSKILTQSGLAILAQANLKPEMDLALLRN
jgi:flagellin